MVEESKQTHNGRAVAVLAFANAMVMVLRFSEQCMLARTLGAGSMFDAYFIGQIVLLLGGQLTVAMTSTGVPLLVELGPEHVKVATRRLLGITTIAVGIACMVLALLSGPLISWSGGGSELSNLRLARTIFLSLVPATGMWVISSVARAQWHSERRFLAPAVGQLFIPLSTCAGALFVTLGFGSITWVAAVANAGAFALLVLLCKPLFFSETKGRGSQGQVIPQAGVIKKFWATLLPVSVALAAMPTMVVVARFFAAALPTGSVTAISLSASVASIPAQFAAASVGVVLLSQASLLKAGGKLEDRARLIERALCNTAFIVIPSAVALVFWSKEVVGLVFQRGAFDAAAVGMTATALRIYSLGIPMQAMIQVLTFALFATAGARAVAGISLLAVVFDLGLTRALAHFGTGGIAAAFSLTSTADCVVLVWLLAKLLPALRVNKLLLRHLRVLLCSLLAVAAGMIGAEGLRSAPARFSFVLGASLSVAIYFGINWSMKMPELQEIVNSLRARVAGVRPVHAMNAAD